MPPVRNNDGADQPPPPQTAWGAWVVIAGLLAITAIFVVAVLHYKKASDVATAVGAASGVIGALVGAYFGIRGATLAQVNNPPEPPGGGPGGTAEGGAAHPQHPA